MCGGNEHENRYNPYKKRVSHQENPTTPHRSQSDSDTPLPPDPTPEDPEEFFMIYEADTTPHSPLGAICIDTYTYGSYFLQHCMDGPLLSKQKKALVLFCDVLELLANLADADVGVIRLDSYITNIITIAHALKEASLTDETISGNRTNFPLITSLALQDRADSIFFLHHTLREQSAAIPLIQEIFAELKTYTQSKLHATLSTFKDDTQQLLTIAQSQSDGAQFSEAERKSMSSLGWLCRHAANTCFDLAQTVPSSPLLAHTASLMHQIQQMLSTMALTYTNLSTNQVRSQDRNSLAARYTQMIEQLEVASPRRGQASYLQYLKTLPSTLEKQTFIEKLFANPQESEQFLQEFFPSLIDSFDYNLTQFCTTLTMQVIDTFAKRYWLCDK